MNDEALKHEIVLKNPDIEARFDLSEDEGSYVEPHWHSSLELVYMLEGTMTVYLRNKEYILLPDEFIIINSGTIHSVLSSKNRALVFQIPREVLCKYIPDIELYYFHVDMHPQTAVEQTRLNKVKKIFTDMYVVYDIRPEGYLLKFNSLFYDLLFSLLHSYSTKLVEQEQTRTIQYRKRVTDIMDYIKAHHREQIKVRQIADALGFNEDYLARFFKQQMGMTMIEYLYAVRVHAVYRELMTTDKKINAIFEEHGCLNYRVASRIFKEKYGCTPKEKRMRKVDHSKFGKI